MEKYQKILEHKKFNKYLNQIEKWEVCREFCCHGLEHLLDVARIAYIMNLERNLGFSKDVIYGAGLLHDLGKVKQYKKKIPHEITGSKKCVKILAECGYEENEIEMIKTAILYHRRGDDPEKNPLSQILYEADKVSRLCMKCEAHKECNWTKEEKNSYLVY